MDKKEYYRLYTERYIKCLFRNFPKQMWEFLIQAFTGLFLFLFHLFMFIIYPFDIIYLYFRRLYFRRKTWRNCRTTMDDPETIEWINDLRRS